MKKLMIAAAIVCAAVVSQAATFDWKTSGNAYTVPAGTKLVDGQTYDAATTAMKSDKVFSYTALFTLTYGTESDPVKVDTIRYSISKINTTGLSSDLFSLPTEDGVTKTYSYSIVITGTDAEGNTLTSNKITGSFGFTKNSSDAFSTSGPSTWTYTAASVPEPTSAMLLLLGMAGLALKRKQK